MKSEMYALTVIGMSIKWSCVVGVDEIIFFERVHYFKRANLIEFLWLQLYFRGHVAIIKLVMKGEDSVDILSLMEQHVIKAAKSPFVSCRETFKTRLSDRSAGVFVNISM